MMEAGRELDALVAEKVMGGYVVNPDAMANVGEIWYWLHPKDGVLCGMPYKVGKMKKWDHQWHRWKPSTDIAAAWQVVEHMRANVPDYRALRMESVPLGYTVAFYSHKNRLDRIGAFVAAETAPCAICLAALKAVGGNQ